jgi:single-strand DNA-binding protein
MAVNINSVVLTGNLTADPAERGNGSVCAMRIAVNGRRKVGDEWQDQVGYFDVVAFGAQGDNCSRFLRKGSAIAVSGRLDWSEWQTESGEKRQAVQVVAQQVQFLSPGTDGPQHSGSSSGESLASQPVTPTSDIPF